MHVDIMCALVGNGRFPDKFASPFGQIIMADKNACFRRQVEYLAYGPVKRVRASAGEIGACGAIIRHEHGVADKCRITDDISYTSGRVAGRVQNVD